MHQDPSISSPDTADPLMSSNLDISDPLMGALLFLLFTFPSLSFLWTSQSLFSKCFISTVFDQIRYHSQTGPLEGMWLFCWATVYVGTVPSFSHDDAGFSHVHHSDFILLSTSCHLHMLINHKVHKGIKICLPPFNFILHLWRVGLAPDGSSVAVNGTMKRAASFLPHLMLEYINSAQCLLFQHSLKSVVSSLPFV